AGHQGRRRSLDRAAAGRGRQRDLQRHRNQVHEPAPVSAASAQGTGCGGRVASEERYLTEQERAAAPGPLQRIRAASRTLPRPGLFVRHTNLSGYVAGDSIAERFTGGTEMAAAAPSVERAAKGAKSAAAVEFLKGAPKQLLIGGKWVAATSG